MEKYSKAVREMYSQFKKKEAHPMEKYVGRLANYYGEKMEVVGYRHNGWESKDLLIVDASKTEGWADLEPGDVVFKECEGYWYVRVSDLIN